MAEEEPPIERHEATDRIGKITLRTAHDLGVALNESDPSEVEPIVVRPGERHATVAGLMALIDEALADHAGSADDAGSGNDAGAGNPEPTDEDPDSTPERGTQPPATRPSS